ncbi:MAG: hypothetical protein HMLIMOIP_000606 [Candidatus Nitrosomirales archaeon]|jgi:hypothetical protein
MRLSFIKSSKIISFLLMAVLAGSSFSTSNVLALYEYDELGSNNFDKIIRTGSDTLDQTTPIRLHSELLNLDGLTYNPDAVRVMITGKGDINAISDQVHVSHYLKTENGYIAFAATTQDKLPLLRSQGLAVSSDVKLEFDQIRDASRLGEILGSDQVGKDFGLTGNGIKIAVVDTGTDFSNGDMKHAVARDVNRRPIMLDADGQGIVLTRTKFIANITPHGNLLNSTTPNDEHNDFTGSVYINDKGVFLGLNRGANGTKFEVYNSIYPLLSPLILNATSTKDWKIGESKSDFIRSMSGVYHMGFVLQIQAHLGRAGLIIVPVLVIDSKEPGVYDTVIADMSSSWADFSKFELNQGSANVEFDYDFTDEEQIRLGDGNEFLVYDEKDDGDVDLSAGTVGAYVLDIWGAMNNGTKPEMDDYLGAVNGTLLKPIDVNGTYFGIMFDYLGHGTGSSASIASRGHDTYDVYKNSTKYKLRGVAPDAKIIPVKALWLGDVVYGWFWASGFEQNSNGTWVYTGKHLADIDNNSWGISTFPALDYGPGYDVLSVLASMLSIPGAIDPDFPGVLMVNSAGNTGFGYGTLGSPSSSPFVLTVGATTNNVFVGSGFTKNEPRFGNSTAFYDDVAEFSSKGPSLFGDVKPEVMSVGAYAFVPMPPNTKHAPNSTGAFGLFGGTSMAAPLASAAAAVVMEGLKKEKIDSDPFLVKSIMMSTASDMNSDPFTQGAGKVDVLNAIDYIKGKPGKFLVYTKDTYATFVGLLNKTIAEYKIKALGNYTLTLPYKELQDSKWYAGYINNGASKEARFMVANQSNKTLSVEIEPTMLELIKQQSINGTTEVRQKDLVLNDTDAGYIPNYINLEKELDIPEDTELMIIKAYFPFEDFLNSTEPVYANSLRIASVYMYDWLDENKDGKVWASETSLVNRGGVWGTVQEVTIRDPVNRIQNTPLLGIYPVPTIYSYWSGSSNQNSTAMNYTLTASFYKKNTWNMVSVDAKELEVGPGGQLVFNARATVPEDALPGIYQGFITVKSKSQTSNIPVSFAVPVTVSSKDVPLVVSGKPDENMLYDNAAVSGSFDMLSRYNAGDWKFYHFNVTDPTINAMSLKISWKNNWTSINAMVTDPSGKIIASSVPAGVFKVFLGWASNDWLGTTNFSEGGGFYPAQNPGGNSTAIYVPVNSTGIYSIMLHTTLFHGKSLSEPIVIEAKPTTMKPDTAPPVISVEFPEYASGVVAIPVNLEEENVEDVLYSVDGSAPVSLRDNSTMVIDTTALREGIHVLSIAASDTVGHRVSRNIMFVADNTGPQLNVRSPEDQSVVKDELKFEIEASDSSLKTISVTLPNGTSVENNNAFSMDTSSLPEGEHKIVIRAEDSAGNIVEDERTISVDRTAPSVEIASPEDGATLSGRVNVKYQVSDDNLESVVLNVGQKSVEITNTGSYTLDTATLFDDKYTLELVAEDKAGNVNEKAVTINTSNFGPSLMNVWIFGILIGAAIGAGIAAAVLLTKYRRKRIQQEPEPQPQPQQDL